MVFWSRCSHYISLLDHLKEDLLPFRALEIQRYTLFVSIDSGKVLQVVGEGVSDGSEGISKNKDLHLTWGQCQISTFSPLPLLSSIEYRPMLLVRDFLTPFYRIKSYTSLWIFNLNYVGS